METLACHQRAPAGCVALESVEGVAGCGRRALAGDGFSDLAIGFLVVFLELVVGDEPGLLWRWLCFGPADPGFANQAAEGVPVGRGLVVGHEGSALRFGDERGEKRRDAATHNRSGVDGLLQRDEPHAQLRQLMHRQHRVDHRATEARD